MVLCSTFLACSELFMLCARALAGRSSKELKAPRADHARRLVSLTTGRVVVLRDRAGAAVGGRATARRVAVNAGARVGLRAIGVVSAAAAVAHVVRVVARAARPVARRDDAAPRVVGGADVRADA